MSEIEKYLVHNPICNKMHDWTEAQETLSLCPDGPDKNDAYEEMYRLMNKCTCGLEDIINKDRASKEQKIDSIILDISIDVQNELLRQCNEMGLDDEQTDFLDRNTIGIFEHNKQKYINKLLEASK